MGEHPHARCRRGTCWEIRGFGHALAVCTTIRSRPSQGTFVSCGFCFFRLTTSRFALPATWHSHLAGAPSRSRLGAYSIEGRNFTPPFPRMLACPGLHAYLKFCMQLPILGSLVCELLHAIRYMLFSIMLLRSRVLVVCCSPCSS